MPGSAVAVVGGEIRRLRERNGLSQGELGRRVGKTQAAVSFWEQGRRVPDLVDLVRLAGALETDLDVLLSGARPRRPLEAVLRAQAGRLMLDEQDVQALERLADAAETDPPPPVELRIANDSPVGAAQELLALAGVTKPPVPVDQIARRCGVRLHEFDLGQGISGFLLDLQSGPVIGYRQSEVEGRQRFSIAHELGHYLLRHYDNFHVDLQSTAELGNPPGYNWRDERSANDFAAQLLMPAAMITQEHARTPNPQKLAARFKVSNEAMGFRLANLGLR